MVSLEQLSSLDCLLWLQSGQSVAKTLAQHQTTVSRHQRKCAQIFAIHMDKSHGEWRISGNTELLQLEREVHQAARLRAQSGLRLDVPRDQAPGLRSAMPAQWLIGASRLQCTQHFSQLLRQRILDAWLVDREHDLPTDDTIALLPLARRSGFQGLAVRREIQRLEPVQALAERLAVHPSGVASGSTSPINHQLKP
ncbi:MAG: hypothetical protein ACPG6X_05545 [Synechococcus sp.]